MNGEWMLFQNVSHKGALAYFHYFQRNIVYPFKIKYQSLRSERSQGR